MASSATPPSDGMRRRKTDLRARSAEALDPALQGPPLLGVVIVNFRGVADTLECLESLLRSSIPMKVVVVENGSGDGSADQIMAWAAGNLPAPAGSGDLGPLTSPPLAKPVSITRIGPDGIATGSIDRLTLIDSPDNLGFAGGNNLGLRHLLADPRLQYFWLLNNDTVVMPDCAAAIVTRMRATPRIGMCGTIVCQYWHPDHLQVLGGYSFNRFTGAGRPLGGGESWLNNFNPQDVCDATDFIIGASLAVSRPFLQKVGPMAEDYFLYFEEIDWATRNDRLGDERFNIAFAHGARMFHKAGASIGSPNSKAGRSPFSYYWLTRSRLKFTWRFYRLLWPWHWLLSWVIAARQLMRRQPKHAAAIVRATLGRKP